VVIDHAGSLHESVDNDGANELESAFLELLRHFDCEWRLRGDRPFVPDGLATDEFHRNVEKSSPSFCISRKIRAAWMVASILARERMMPGSSSRRSMSASLKRATLTGSKPLKALRKASRLRRTMIQARPA